MSVGRERTEDGLPPLADNDAMARAGTLYPDVRLVDQAIRNARRVRGIGNRNYPRGTTLWVVVSDLLSTGSTHAHGLCRRFGLDPNEPIG